MTLKEKIIEASFISAEDARRPFHQIRKLQLLIEALAEAVAVMEYLDERDELPMALREQQTSLKQKLEEM
jgi:hypothetical protein